jgi:exonuclease SbcC
VEAKIVEVDQALGQLGYDENLLGELTATEDTLKTQAAAVEEHLGKLDAATVTYRKQEPTLRATERTRRIAGRLALLFLLVTVFTLGPWALMTYAPESPVTTQVATWLEGRVELPWLLYAGAASGVILLLLWIRSAVLGARIRGLRQAGQDLKDAWLGLKDLDEGLQANRAALGNSVAARPVPESGDRERELQRIATARAGDEEVRRTLVADEAWLARAAGRIAQRLEDVAAAIEDARGVEAEYNRLSEIKAGFEQQIESHRHRIRLREMAENLLMGALRQLSNIFTGNLRGLAGVTLPLFTENRYQHVMIDDSLTVRLFSNIKRDYMDMDEVSTGTQRQVLLALRLALAQELINRVVESKQFVFLDEPFAFFDDSRMRSALSVLPRLSKDIPQVWVTGQHFPAEAEFDHHIHVDLSAETYPAEQRESNPALSPQDEEDTIY